MTTFGLEIVAVLGGTSAFIGLAAWLLKSLITNWLKKDLASFKSGVESAATSGIEQVKAYLGQLSTEHEVRFSLLHTKRAEIISQLYEQIVDALAHTLVLARSAEDTGVAPHRQRAEAARESLRTALRLLHTRKIWLSEALATKVDHLIAELQGPSLSYYFFLIEKYSEQDVLEAAKRWAAKEGEIHALIEDLEREFRRELFVISSTALPSNRTVETDARKSGARLSP